MAPPETAAPVLIRQLLPPGAGAVEPYDFYRLSDPHGPWLRVNMISSLDGLVTDAEGRAGGLGAEGDLAAFRAQRALADAILVGAGTARVEGYGPHRLHATIAARRAADGRDRPAAVAVVSRSLDLDPEAPLFRDAVTPTIVVTCAQAPASRLAELGRVAELVVAGVDDVDLRGALTQLRARGHTHVLCEGGPRLNTALFALGLADELCLTLAPNLVGRSGKRIVEDTTAPLGGPLSLAALGHADGELFARYRFTRVGGGAAMGGGREADAS